MNPVYRVLALLGLHLSKIRYTYTAEKSFPPEFLAQYESTLAELQKSPPRGFKVLREVRYDAGSHPEQFYDFECQFASGHIYKINPGTILDIGSYRMFIMGLLSHYQVTTIDVRDRRPQLKNEKVVTCDAKSLPLPDNSFDLVTSLCALEHFGLGRYGDAIDMEADIKGFNEMVRVLKPNGHLIFTTQITRAHPTIVFNSHRIYDYRMIRNMCSGLSCVEERFFSLQSGVQCPIEKVISDPNGGDIYLGCYKK